MSRNMSNLNQLKFDPPINEICTNDTPNCTEGRSNESTGEYEPSGQKRKHEDESYISNKKRSNSIKVTDRSEKKLIEFSISRHNSQNESNSQNKPIDTFVQRLHKEKGIAIKEKGIAIMKNKNRQSRIMRRKYDTAKHCVLTLLETQVEKNNVIFDEEASDKKKEIFGYDWPNTCIWTGATTQLSVDHIFPIRGVYGNRKNVKTGWLKEGLRGSDSQWNTIMVYKAKNAGFKIFDHKKVHGWKKDISLQILTSEELEQCTQQERDLYIKIRRWRMYAKERGASFCWQFEEETNRKIEQIYTDTYKLLEERISKLDVKLVSPSRVHERLASQSGAASVVSTVVDLPEKAQLITSYFKNLKK